jgi:hypothetical protein
MAGAGSLAGAADRTVHGGGGSLSSSRTYDARPDAESYVQNRLGPSPLVAKFGPALIVLPFLAFPVIFLILGILMFGLPPLSAPVLVPFLGPIVAFGGLAVYLFRKGMKGSTGFPDSYTVDSDGIDVHRPDGAMESIDWDDRRLYFQLIDRRPYLQIRYGATQISKGGTAYPVPAEMFDLVLREATERGLAGPPNTYVAARGGRVTRVIVAANPRLR